MPLRAAAVEDDFMKCGDLDRFKAVSYLKVVEELQALPESYRVKALVGFSSIPNHDRQVVILCRMLFAAKPNGEFRRPLLGMPGFIDSAGDAPGTLETAVLHNWPLEPISVVDKVPFSVVMGYMLAGVAESSGSYLAYCLKETQWSPVIYHPASRDQMEGALKKLGSQIPKKLLTPSVKEFLRQQIDTEHGVAQFKPLESTK